MCEIIEWKEVPNFPKYKVSSHGDILSFYKYTAGEPLAKSKDEHGYLKISLRQDHIRLSTTIHRMVAELFLGPPPSNKHDAHHKDNNKENNCVLNLEWMLHERNISLSHKNPNRATAWTYTTPRKGCKNAARLNITQVYQILELRKILTLKQLSKLFNVHFSTVSKINLRILWSELPYPIPNMEDKQKVDAANIELLKEKAIFALNEYTQRIQQTLTK